MTTKPTRAERRRAIRDKKYALIRYIPAKSKQQHKFNLK